METTDGLFGERARHGLWVLESSSAGALVVVPPGRLSAVPCAVGAVRCKRIPLLGLLPRASQRVWDNGRLVGYVRVCGPASVELSPPGDV